MPTLVLNHVPNEVIERLQRRADIGKRSVPEETVHLLNEVLLVDNEVPWPEWLPSDEVSAPCDLPLPGPGLTVTARAGEPPLLDAATTFHWV